MHDVEDERQVRHAEQERDDARDGEADEGEAGACGPTRARRTSRRRRPTKMKPTTKPKLGLRDARRIVPVKPAKTGSPARPDEHVGREAAAPRQAPEGGADDDHAERLAGDRHGPERDRDLREQRDEGGAGDDERGVDGERAGARGRTRDDVGENAAAGGGGGDEDMGLLEVGTPGRCRGCRDLY